MTLLIRVNLKLDEITWIVRMSLATCRKSRICRSEAGYVMYVEAQRSSSRRLIATL